jgi:toxin ParE1/3/4
VKVKPVIPRALANRDLDEAIAHYVNEGGEGVALRFIDAVERAYHHLGRQPASGSPRYAHDLNIPGLRFWPLGRFPYLVFYVEVRDHVDIWRVLHGRRDIPAWMREPGGSREP